MAGSASVPKRIDLLQAWFGKKRMNNPRKEEPDETTTSSKRSKTRTSLRALGFCGADDSVNPKLLGIISNSYPFVEFGVLFRPDKEGQPRYATSVWVEQLMDIAKRNPQQKMKLAAHFCGNRVNEVLNGDDSFLETLSGGFQRVQINATAVNGVNMSQLEGGSDAVNKTVQNFTTVIQKHLEFEFIIQKNEETRPLWEGLLSANGNKLPKNVSMLVDESKGTGTLSSSAWPSPPDGYEIGYAGGIGPDNIKQVLEDVIEAGKGRAIWIDMESSLRSMKNGKDVFDLDKCYQVIEETCATGLHSHPDFLLS